MDPFEARMRAAVGQCVYKDWIFCLGKDGIGLWYLQMRWTGDHATTGERQEWSGRKWRLSMHMTDSEIVQTALMAVLAAEEHETRERFTFKGRAIFGPHLSIERLWHLAGKSDALDVRE